MEQDLTPRGGPALGMYACDQELFERVWQRIMPEDRPDCPITPDAPVHTPTPVPEARTAAPAPVGGAGVPGYTPAPVPEAHAAVPAPVGGAGVPVHTPAPVPEAHAAAPTPAPVSGVGVPVHTPAPATAAQDPAAAPPPREEEPPMPPADTPEPAPEPEPAPAPEPEPEPPVSTVPAPEPPVSAPPEKPEPLESQGPAGDDFPRPDAVPCLGSGSANHGKQLQEDILAALEGWQLYRHLARKVTGSASRTLSALASEKHKQARKLAAAHFLISGVRFWPTDKLESPRFGSWLGTLRRRFAAEQQLDSRWRAASIDTDDACLAVLYGELAEDCAAHAGVLRSLLEQAL